MQLHKTCGNEVATAFTHADGHFLYCSHCNLTDLNNELDVLRVCDEHCIENCPDCEE